MISLEDIGLLVNLAGSVLLVISIGKFPKEFGGSTTGEDGKPYHFAYFLHPRMLKFGLCLLVLGFLFQIVGSNFV